MKNFSREIMQHFSAIIFEAVENFPAFEAYEEEPYVQSDHNFRYYMDDFEADVFNSLSKRKAIWNMKGDFSTDSVKQELVRLESLFNTGSFAIKAKECFDEYPMAPSSLSDESILEYSFDRIENDISNGIVYLSTSFHVIRELLATCYYYTWIEDIGIKIGLIPISKPIKLHFSEPQEFIRIWVNPEKTIPLILGLLKKGGFIDNDQKNWILNSGYHNPMGVIRAIQGKGRNDYIIQVSDKEILKAFIKRFNLPDKRYEAKNGPFKKAFERFTKLMDNNA